MGPDGPRWDPMGPDGTRAPMGPGPRERPRSGTPTYRCRGWGWEEFCRSGAYIPLSASSPRRTPARQAARQPASLARERERGSMARDAVLH